MSFPHRTAFYDRECNTICKPENIAWAHVAHRHGGEQYVIHTKSEECLTERYIPLVSTGLEDSEGNEIFEGHIITTKHLNSNYRLNESVVFWDDKVSGFRILGEQVNHFDFRQYGKHEIEGHALTDPDLVPDNFDVSDYFEIGDSNDNN